MKKIILLIALSGIMVMCKTGKKKSEETTLTPKIEHTTPKSEIVIYNDFATFQKEILDVAQTKPTLINFWATWCVPCMEEMPIFLEMYRNEKYSNINFVFVNMDFKQDIETKVKDYVTKEKIISNTVVLNAPKPNQWINKVSEKWSGALPFTLIIHNGKTATHGGKFHNVKEVEELLETVNLTNKQ